MHDLLQTTIMSLKSYIEMNGVFAAAIVDVALKPLSDPTVANLVPALGAGIMLWRKKRWIFSGLFQLIK